MGALRAVTPNILEMPNRQGFDVLHAVRRTMLDAHAKSVLMVLASYVDANGWAFVGSGTLAMEAGVEDGMLVRVKRILGELGVLTYTRLSKAERLQARAAGGDGMFREEEWQLNLGMLGRDLVADYKRLADEFFGKAKPAKKKVAATNVAETVQAVAATENFVAATNPSDSLLGRTTKEPHGTPTRAEAAPQGVESRMLALAATAVRAACGWKGLLVDREVMPACVEALGDLCRELGCDASEASALVIEAWKLDQRSANPTLVPARWFGGPWRRWVDCVLAARAAEAKRAEVGVERRVELDAMLVECDPEAVDAWRAVLARLERVVNRQSFATWMRPTKGLRMEGDVLVVRVPSGQFLHLGQRYERELAEALSVVECGVSSVRFEA